MELTIGTNEIRPLTDAELDSVEGGVIWVVPAGVAAAGVALGMAAGISIGIGIGIWLATP
jgi:hypothetical protein